ncbi:MAG: ATP-binding protein [Comamonadaceae bacterium]|nr:MAG: ATP-binding protein [Comamonadaceae bacterium]
MLTTDRTKLVQVLNNVLSNAVKFTDAGSVTIAAQVAAGTLAIRVRDTGRGIDPERLPHIFDRFQTVGSESERHAGTGLGLALSRELLNLLGGSIAVQSTLGQGTEITIQLPGVRLEQGRP